MKIIKVKLKEILKEKGMTMTELHEITGISQNALSQLSTGKSGGIQFSTLDKILDALNTEVGDLIEHSKSIFNFSAQLKEVWKEDRGMVIEKDQNLNYFRYEIIATSKETNKTYEATMTFSCSWITLNHNQTISISKRERSVKDTDTFGHERLASLLSHPQSKRLLPVLSYLITLDLIKRDYIEPLTMDSLVFFSWRGFVPSNPKAIVIIDLHFATDTKVLPNIHILKDSDFIKDIIYDSKSDHYSADIQVN